MTATLKGLRYWTKATDEEGHRDYTLVWNVATDDPLDDPSFASGLPLPGVSLNVSTLVDAWAFYQRKADAKLRHQEKYSQLWDVSTVFTTRPNRRCQSDQIEDPLLEPVRVKGSFAQIVEELLKDHNGAPIQNSAEQRYTGAIVQDTVCRSVVELEMNVAWIDLGWLAEYANSYNDATWWGQPARSIKCVVGPWEQVLYGTCYFYFVVRFTFELKYPNWDLVLLDEGTRVKVTGSSPARYVQYKDEREENGRTLLNGSGAALAAGATPVWKTFQRPNQQDFSAVGWPASLL